MKKPNPCLLAGITSFFAFLCPWLPLCLSSWLSPHQLCINGWKGTFSIRDYHEGGEHLHDTPPSYLPW